MKILLGLSGGVDSAVAAYLLKKKGFDVRAAFMRNWDDKQDEKFCSGDKEFEDAKIVANHLKINLTEVNFSKEYWLNIFSDFIKDYEEGRTPNPDILCNQIIKFDLFFKHAVNNLNCDAIATGHYARTSFGDFLQNYKENENVKLLEAADTFKDQTFFLSRAPSSALRHCLFPVGSLKKSQVKEIAKSIGLANIERKTESTGLCFVGKRPFQSFISQFIPDKPGNFVDIESGRIEGTHQGIHMWTLGQRTNFYGPSKNFVWRKDVERRIIYTVAGTDNPLLYSDLLIADDLHWMSGDPMRHNKLLECEFRFQHTKPKVKCKIYKSDKILIKLEQPLRALTPGQYAVFYKDGECLGSARIVSAGTGPRKLEKFEIN